ncbi:MAG: hypothetical protein ABIF01_04225 [Candidatus Micrarchaeota archaeon]
MDLGIFMRCEECQKELEKDEKRTTIDDRGFTHTYCVACFSNLRR